MTVPKNIDFKWLADEANKLAQEITDARLSRETVVNPRILCVVSEDYVKKDYELDIKAIQSSFSETRLTTIIGTNSVALRRLLRGNKFDIIHFVLEIDEFTGALNLNHTTNDGLRIEDGMTAEGFASEVVG